MSVLCLVEHDANGPTGLSLQALTLARGHAHEVGTGLEALVIGEPSEVGLSVLADYGVDVVHVAAGAQLAAGYCGRAWAKVLSGLSGLSGPSGLGGTGREAGAPGGTTRLPDEAALPAAAAPPGDAAPPVGAARPAGDAGTPAVRTVIAAGSDRGSEVLAHLAASQGLPLAAHCIAVAGGAPGQSLRVTRLRWAGSLLEDAELEGCPSLVTVAPQGVAALPAEQRGAAVLQPLAVQLVDEDLTEQLVSAVARESGAVSLADAKVVIGGGRGVGGPEGFAVLEELAALLDAAVGVSRVATSLGWRPHRDQVGQTGTRIAPELYIACGISGAIQHMAGCKSAKHLMAINTDPDAPIMRAADYAVVGDLHQVLPAVIERLRAELGRGPS